jgi:hypothetical protein
MRNALVAGDGDLRFDARRTFYPKVIHESKERRLSAKRRARRRIPSCGQMSSRRVRAKTRSGEEPEVPKKSTR